MFNHLVEDIKGDSNDFPLEFVVDFFEKDSIVSGSHIIKDIIVFEIKGFHLNYLPIYGSSGPLLFILVFL